MKKDTELIISEERFEEINSAAHGILLKEIKEVKDVKDVKETKTTKAKEKPPKSR